jgi:hypothetical protein
MNILTFLRKPYLAILLSVLILFSSCGQYGNEIENKQSFDNTQSFNYESFNKFKSQEYKININSLKSKKSTSLEKNRNILNQVNTELGTDLIFPDKALELVDYDKDEIFQISLKEGWMSQQDVDLTNDFISDIRSNGIDKAISNYEKTILNLSLSNEEFARQNIFLNLIKSINFTNPNLFKMGLQDKSLQAKYTTWYKCGAASIALAAATASMASCVTIAACGLAIILVYEGSVAVEDNCLE